MQLRNPRGYWTFERCQEEALKYDTRRAFSEHKPSSAYSVARRKGWLDQICGHMTSKEKPKNYWTSERCRAEALKYPTRSAFQKEAGGAYDAAKHNGWFDQICGHMEEIKKSNGYWTFERCQAEALKYKTQSDFQLKASSVYQTIKRNKWSEQICGHMTTGRKPRKWAFERCRAEALKYNTRSAFAKGSGGACNRARIRGWLDQICAHMVDGSPSDGNCFYLWLVVGAFFNGLPVYKFGVTSIRLHLGRIKQVARAGGFEYDLVLWAPVTNAYDLEAKVKAMGASPQYTGFSGCTEFRALTEEEVGQIKSLAMAEFVL